MSSSNVNSVSVSGVVQLDMDGNSIFVSDVVGNSEDKNEAKKILGGVQKIQGNEILVADSKNKRAIIIDTSNGKIKWEYNSDRYVIDARIVLRDNITILLDNNCVDEETIVNKSQSVIWRNNTGADVIIYSGDYGDTDISVDFDSNLYGDIFESPTISDGGSWVYTFNDNQEVPWFTYPEYCKGTIISTEDKISLSNQFLILESDGLNSPFSSRVVRIDCWGNVLWEYKDMIAPRDIRSLLDNKVLIST